MDSPLASAGRARRAGPFRVREVAYAAGVRQTPHAHELCGITLVVAGVLSECARGREEFASALSVVVKPAGIEHANEFGPRGAHTLQILIDPADAVLEPETPRALADWRWLHGGSTAAESLALLRLLRRAEASGTAELEDRALGVLAAVCGDATVTGTPPAWLRRVREALDDAYGGRLAELAREVGAHPVSVSRAFRRHFACSVSEYRKRVRLRRAAAAIEASSHSFSRVAYAAGYADHAHLCREFKRATGLTPSQFRNLDRGA